MCFLCSLLPSEQTPFYLIVCSFQDSCGSCLACQMPCLSWRQQGLPCCLVGVNRALSCQVIIPEDMCLPARRCERTLTKPMTGSGLDCIWGPLEGSPWGAGLLRLLLGDPTA